MDQNTDDIDAWRRVHQKLTMAIVQSRDNIATELVKRRYLLEEMNRCKMQTNTSLRSYAKKKGKIAPPPAAVEGNNTIIQAPTQGDVQKDVEQITDIALGSSTYMYNQPPMGMSTAASEAMQLAFQMMEQMNNQNKSKSTEESSGDDDEDTEGDKTE